MKAIDPAVLVQQLQWRYATKVFDSSKKIPADVWKALEDALILTPSSFGLQPWKFFVVTDQSVKEKLSEASWKQKQPAQCSHHVVMAIKKEMGAADVARFIDRQIEVTGAKAEVLEGYKKLMTGFITQPKEKFNVDHWAALQVYIALGNFMTAAAMVGVDTCPMEGIDPAKYDEILGLAAKGYRTFVACAAGYRASDDKYASQPKVRYKKEDVIERI